MPEPHVLYLVTAAVIAGLVVWVALALKSAKEPWARAVPAASEGAAAGSSGDADRAEAESEGEGEGRAKAEVKEDAKKTEPEKAGGADPDETAPDPADEAADTAEDPAEAKKG
jgi:hypothetical protein